MLSQRQPARSAATPKLHQAVTHTGQRRDDPDTLRRSLNITGTAKMIDVCSNLDLDCGVGGGGYFASARRPHDSFDARLQQKKLKDELITDAEIDYLIREKLRKEQYAVECLFRNADPSRCGKVQRNALLRILYSICGHIRFEQFHRLLDRLGLDDKQTVSFADFKASFAADASSSPTSAEVGSLSLGGGPQIGRYSSKPVSVAHAFTMLRQRAAQPGFEPRDILPPACFEPAGVVLKPHLLRALSLLRIPLAPGDADKFWDRIDLHSTGAVSTSQLMTLLGIGGGDKAQTAPARSKTAPSNARRRNHELGSADGIREKLTDEAQLTVPDQKATAAAAAAAAAASPETAEASAAKSVPDFKYLRRFELLRKNRPVFDHFMDAFYYMFEEPYKALLVAFQHLDSDCSGRVTIGDLQRVLKEFGFPTADGPDSVGFEQFLIRFGLRPGYMGAVSYADLLGRLQAKGPNSLLSRYLISDKTPIAFEENQQQQQNLSPYQMELRLLQFLHRDYLTLHFGFAREDPNNTGFVSEEAFHSVLSRVNKAEVPANQLAGVLTRLPRSRGGAVQYKPFLEQFYIAPNMWAKQPHCPPLQPEQQLQQQQPLTPLLQQQSEVAPAGKVEPPVVKEVKFKQKTQKPKQRSLFELSCLTQDTLTAHFHQVDKLYKQMDRRNTGRISCKQLRSILNALGLAVTEPEMAALWATLDTSPDSQWSYRQMLRHFMAGELQEATLQRLRARNGWVMSDAADLSVVKLRQLRTMKPKEDTEAQQQQQQPVQQSADSLSTSELDSLIERCRPAIVEHWEEAKMRLRRLDPQGTAFIYRAEFKELVREFQLPLIDAEAERLSMAFEKRANGRFNYMAFLKRFVSQSDKPASQTVELARTVTDKKQGARVKISEIMDKIRQKLLFEWKSLLLAFRKYDVEKSGRLSLHELRKIVARCGYRLSEDDMFLLLSEFDMDFDGMINYQEFVMQLLDVAEAA